VARRSDRHEMVWGQAAPSSLQLTDGVPRCPQPNDLSRSLVALDQDRSIIAVVEMSQSSWLVGGVIPGIERQPRKKLEPNVERLLGLLHRWRNEAVSWPRRLLVGAVAECAWCGGAGDPFFECRSITATLTGKNRPASHWVAEAGVLGVAAWGMRPLQHGARPDDWQSGQQAT
jgi:hypothetical protein